MADRQKLLEDIKEDITPSQFAQLQGMLKDSLVDKPRQRLSQIPLLVPLVGAFGLVSTFYGFEKILDRTFLVDQPVAMIAIGIVLLLVTGAAARKL